MKNVHFHKISEIGQAKVFLKQMPNAKQYQACLRSPWFTFPVGAMRPIPTKSRSPTYQHRQPVLTQPKELTFQLSF